MSVVIVMARRSAALPREWLSGPQGNDDGRVHDADREHAESHGDDRSAERGEIDHQRRQHALESRGRRQADHDPDDARDQPDDRGRQQQRARHPA